VEEPDRIIFVHRGKPYLDDISDIVAVLVQERVWFEIRPLRRCRYEIVIRDTPKSRRIIEELLDEGVDLTEKK
jgi:hypothetical protein